MAIQGDVLEHVDALKLAMARLGLEGSVKAVKRSVDLEKLDCVVIPGGESTVIGRVAERKGLLGALKKRIEDGLPVFGTCAGAILLAKEVYDAKVGEVDQPLLKVMDVRIARNYYGRQRESFEVDLHIPV
ncbi:MAG: pyridoxal 5'-phosphate synthase glutaminase subunit PdxT, partial [Thermoprotei archaeon]